MDYELNGVDAMKFQMGMAPFLGDALRIRSPKVRSVAKRFRRPFLREDEFYWLVRAAANQMLAEGHDSDVVIGIAVVRQSCVALAVFTENFKQADKVNREGAIVSYQLTACAYEDDTWMLKVEQENFDVQFPT
jgi:hypothetical protein